MTGLLVIVLAAYFACTAVVKVRSRAGFMGFLSRFVPSRSASLAAGVVIGAETSVAALLLLNAEAGAYAAGTFILLASAVVAFGETRQAYFSCGCWGNAASTAQPQPWPAVGGYRNPQDISPTWRGLLSDVRGPVVFAARNSALLAVTTFILCADQPWRWLAVISSAYVVPAIVALGLLWDIVRRRHELTLPLHPARPLFVPHARALVAMTWYGNRLGVEAGTWRFVGMKEDEVAALARTNRA